MERFLFSHFTARNYSQSLKACSAAYFVGADHGKVKDIAHGGKIILPNSALDNLIRLNVQYPMLFKVRNEATGLETHCGVLEFSAPEGRAYLPNWMMHQLNLEEESNVKIEVANLRKATFAKLKPQSLDFLNISNPRAVLEVELRKFACLTKNDRISVLYADQNLEFLVQEVKPEDAVCIIECDLNLDFDAPEGFVENSEHRPTTTVKPPPPPPDLSALPSTQFAAFSGSGVRLDGKKKPSSNSICSEGIPDSVEALGPVVCISDYKPGTLHFMRYDYKSRVVMEKEINERAEASKKQAVPFQGGGATIRRRY
ncbi:unnamed protein product [Auanema sp. JU1783]|nr:unnamed protein product [Auanema sp. JU1783]